MVQRVNGFSCHNPAQVALAKRGIDPAAAKPGASPVPAPAQTPNISREPVLATDLSRVGRGRFVDLIA